MSILNERIKQRREALGMSQAELAELLGYSDRSTIAKIEKGTNDITQSKIEAFAKVLQTTPAYLMGWENDSGEQDLGLTALDVAKWLEVPPDAVESVMEEMGWPNPTKPEVLSKISAEVERRKICSIGQRIKEARKLRGMTQRELAEKARAATGTIQQYELGKRQPRLEQLLAIADALGVSVSYLLTGETENLAKAQYIQGGYYFDLGFLDLKLRSVECAIWDNPKRIQFPDGALMVKEEELQELDESTDNYIQFKLLELKQKHMDRWIDEPLPPNPPETPPESE